MSITSSNSELKVIIPLGSINSSAPQVTFCIFLLFSLLLYMSCLHRRVQQERG